MTDPPVPLTQFVAVSPHTFITFTEGEILHAPSSPFSFLPTALTYQGGEWDWNSPAYATFADTPMTEKLLHAALVVVANKLEERVVLPSNVRQLSESANASDHQKLFVAQYRTSAAIYGYWVHLVHANSAPMVKALKNWRATCNKLVTSPHFSKGWTVPAFFPVYNMYCTEACME
mmetsp:Transcript_13495/g.19357  ORF Transcript_13495/g.19357 Transcript_13495/m.19357 type:complete len:175 (-) Transcript_13495:2257-2781(-)